VLASSPFGETARFDVSEVEFDADGIDIQRAARVYRDVGFLVVRGLMKKYVEVMVAEVRDAVTLAHRELPDAEPGPYGRLTPGGAIFADRGVEGPYAQPQLIVAPLSTESSAPFKGCSKDPRLLDVLGVFLDNDVNLIGKGQCMYKEARRGGEAGLHQDAIYPGGEGHSDITSTFTYLVPTSIDRGCIWLVPHSQRSGLFEHEKTGLRAGSIPQETCNFDRAVPLPGEAGDTLIWNYMLVHGSKGNVTDVPRPALVLRYGRRGASRR
jgi:hypothetical protein